MDDRTYRKRHRFFLNPYEDMAFTKCPKCDRKTKQRKLPLVIHIDSDQMFVLNKTCRFCPDCDLVIVRQHELEAMMATAFDELRREIVGNGYLVVGTLDRADWNAGKKKQSSPYRDTRTGVYLRRSMEL